MRRLILSIILIAFAPALSYAAPPQVVSVRTGAHQEFDRLVVELDGPAPFTVSGGQGEVRVNIEGATLLSTDVDRGAKETTLFDVREVASSDGSVYVAISAPDGVRVEKTVYKKPFRIVVDFRPEATPSKEDETKAQAAAPSSPTVAKEKADAAPPEKAAGNGAGSMKKAEKGGGKKDGGIKIRVSITGEDDVVKDFDEDADVAFSGGWRWLYRLKLIDRLREEVVARNPYGPTVAAEALGLDGSDEGSVMDALRYIALYLASSGEVEKAETISAMIRLIEDGHTIEDAEKLAALVRTGHDPELLKAGHFLLGCFYESIGFIPEAEAYYSMVIGGYTYDPDPPTVVKGALMRKGRLHYFDGRYQEAKRWLVKAEKAGAADASLWLANTLLIKGEHSKAWALYKKNRVESADPVTLLSVADLSLEKGEVANAGRIYGALWDRYSKDEFIGAFFRTRMGDTLFAEGKTKKARMIFEELRGTVEGEGWAMASLALAELLISTGEGEAALAGAVEIYAEVSGKDLFGSSVAYIELARNLSELGDHERAIGALTGYTARFPTGYHRAKADELKRIIAFRWLMALYDNGDWLGMARLNTRFSYVIPFGRKSETFVKMGRAYVELGLYPDAVGPLNNAIRLADDAIAEEAMALLAQVYYEQNDAVAVEKLMSTFVAKFPASARLKEMKGMLLRVLVKNGEYAKAAQGFEMLDDGPSLLLRAAASLATGESAVARDLYLEATGAFNRKADHAELAAAYLGAGDAEYSLGGYREAAGYYRKSLATMPEGEGPDRTWALYRMTQSYSRLGLDEEKAGTLAELAEAGSGEIPGWAETIFKGRGNP